MKCTNTLTVTYIWDESETILEKMELESKADVQKVTLERVGDDQYTYTSDLIGDEKPVVSESTHTLHDALSHTDQNDRGDFAQREWSK